MPHVAFVPLTGLRIRAEEMLELGMTMPALRQRADAVAELPALGLLTLAGMTPPPWSCSYHDAAHWDESVVDEVMATRPSLVALSALTASIDAAYRLSAAFRERRVPVVLGGLHATACAEEASRYCDAVVVGEGEPVWRDVLRDAEEGTLRQRYACSSAFDLARSPLPRFDLVQHDRRSRWTLQTERGCPFACDFCGASRLLGPFREKPVDRIRAELTRIGQLARAPRVELADDNTFAGGRNAEALLEALGEADLRYFTEADWRIGERPDVLRNLAASGCVQVLIGIESQVYSYAGMGAKQAGLERIMDSVSAIQEAGIVANGCFIVGADGETHDSLDHLVEVILESPLAEVQLTVQTPFPGTALYRSLERAGRLREDCDWSHYTLFDVAYRPDPMTAAELRSGFHRVTKTVFAAGPAERRSGLRKRILRSRTTAG